MANMATTADTISLFEEIMELSGEPTFAMNEDTGNFNESMTKEKLHEMQADPRYWKDQDPAFINRVQAGYRKLSKGK